VAAGTLSGGEQQMLAIGRAMMHGPRVLLLDEMSLGLAPITAQAVYASLDGVFEGLTVLLVEGMAWLADFYRDHPVTLVCSLPCYTPENVDKQRGRGVFPASSDPLPLLNRLGDGCPGPSRAGRGGRCRTARRRAPAASASRC